MTPTVVLSIAGSDFSRGAGIEAGVKTFAALGVYGARAPRGSSSSRSERSSTTLRPLRTRS